MAELRISPEKVCFVIAKARELDVSAAPGEPDDGPLPTDDGEPAVPEDDEDDEDAAVVEELSAFLSAQSDDELQDLLALTWVGEGDYGLDEWDEALEAARDVPSRRIVEQLIALPLLGDFLEEGLAEFGLACDEVETGHW